MATNTSSAKQNVLLDTYSPVNINPNLVVETIKPVSLTDFLIHSHHPPLKQQQHIRPSDQISFTAEIVDFQSMVR